MGLRHPVRFVLPLSLVLFLALVVPPFLSLTPSERDLPTIETHVLFPTNTLLSMHGSAYIHMNTRVSIHTGVYRYT